MFKKHFFADHTNSCSKQGTEPETSAQQSYTLPMRQRAIQINIDQPSLKLEYEYLLVLYLRIFFFKNFDFYITCYISIVPIYIINELKYN